MASNAQEVEPELFIPEAVEPKLPQSLLLIPTDAAKLLGVGKHYMYRLIHDGPENGGVISIRMARKILVPRKALEDWVTKRMREAGGTDA